MKKFLLTFAMVVVSFALFAQNTTKIYINPGHGGYDSDDRPQPLYPFSSGDTLHFWESSSNLDKGLILYYMLDSLNQIPGEDGWEFMISRTLNRTVDDRNLSAIVAESNAFGSNFMLSIHTNAGNPANYPLMLYSGVDEGDDLDSYAHRVTDVNNAEGRAVSKLIGDNIRALSLVPWTNAMQLRGDKTFGRVVMDNWSNGYGVLRWLETPGVISEARMHDYAPETYRLMNHEYRWLEAWHFLHAFVHYYKGRTLKTGNIAGDVRDRFISIEEAPAFKPIIDGGQGKYYRKGTRDAMMPLNGANVALMQNGDTLRTYKVDEYFNGFWLFGNLEPGAYEVSISKDGYHDQVQEIVVKADETTYVTYDMQAVRNTPPVVMKFAPENNEFDSIDCASFIYVDWNWSMDPEATESAFSIEPAIDGTFTWENYGTRLVFTPTHPFKGNTLYTVRIATTAAHPDTVYENNLQEEYVSKFLTKKYDTLRLLAVSPAEGDESPLKPTFQLLFDGILDIASNDYIYVEDADGNVLSKNARTQKWNTIDGLGTVKFDFAQALTEGKTYKIVVDEFAKTREGITTRVKKEIPFTAVNLTEPLLTKVLDCSAVAFTAVDTLEGVKKAKVTATTTGKLFKKCNKFVYEFVDSAENAYVEFDLITPLEVENGVEMSIPLKSDFTHNKLQFKYVNEDASNILYVDFITLSSFNWDIYNTTVRDIPADGKRWYLQALVVEKTGHVANAFDGEFYVENIYGTFKNVPVDVEHVFGNGVSVWPNPASEYVSIDAPECASIEIFSVDGRLITSIPAVNMVSEDNSLRTISIRNFTLGTYIVKISTEKGLQSLKFVKY